MKKNFKQVIFTFFIFIILAVVSCSQEKIAPMESKVAENAGLAKTSFNSNDAGDEGEAVELAVKERKLIKNGYIEFETKNIAETTGFIQGLVTEFAGYISNESESFYEKRQTKNLTIRLPSQDFDKFIEALSKGVSKFKNKNIHIDDVTMQFIDYETRLAVKKETEARYVKLLEQANNVSEIVEIERELQNLRGEIESLEGQLRYLSSQVSLSTLEVYFFTETATSSNIFSDIADAFSNGGRLAYRLFLGLISLWSIILIIAGIIVLIVILRKRKNNKT